MNQSQFVCSHTHSYSPQACTLLQAQPLRNPLLEEPRNHPKALNSFSSTHKHTFLSTLYQYHNTTTPSSLNSAPMHTLSMLFFSQSPRPGPPQSHPHHNRPVLHNFSGGACSPKYFPVQGYLGIMFFPHIFLYYRKTVFSVQPLPNITDSPGNKLQKNSKYNCRRTYLYLVHQNGLVCELHQWLGARKCERTQPSSITAHEDDGLHPVVRFASTVS